MRVASATAPIHPPGLDLRRPAARFLLLSALLLMAAFAGTARAACEYPFDLETVVFTPTQSIVNVPANAAYGDVLMTTALGTPNPQQNIDCENNTRTGLRNLLGNTPSGTLFPTGISGLSYRILHPDGGTLLSAYPDYHVDSGTFSVESALQLIYTGPIQNGSVLAAGSLAQWELDSYETDWCYWWGGRYRCNKDLGRKPIELFTLTSPVTFASPSCSIATDPTVVTLNPVLSSQFGGPGSTAADKQFVVALTQCTAGVDVAITLDATTPAGFNDSQGVIESTGTASGVGVQLLKSNGSSAVHFNTSFGVGTMSAGSNDIKLYARYYQTGTSVSGGTVEATATYTLTYQ